MTAPDNTRTIPLPAGIPIKPYRPPPTIQVPVGQSLPLIAKEDHPSKQIQEIRTARVGIFKLSDEKQLAECQAVWQRVVDGLAHMSENRTEFGPDGYVTLLRWLEISHKLPT